MYCRYYRAHVGGVTTGRGVKQIVGRRGEKDRHYSVAPAISTTPWLPSSPFCLQPPGIAPLPPGSSPYFGVIYCDTIVTRGGRGQDYVLVQNFKSRQRECSQKQWRARPFRSTLPSQVLRRGLNASHHTEAASPNHMLRTNSLKFYGWPAASSLRPA